MLNILRKLAIPVLATAMIAFAAGPAMAKGGKGGGGGGHGGGHGGGRGGGAGAASFRAGPSGTNRGGGGREAWNGRGDRGRGDWARGDWGRRGDWGGWGWWGPSLWGWNNGWYGGYYNPWYYDGYAYGGYPADYSSFYYGPNTYSDETYANQAPAGGTMPDEDAAMIAVRVPPDATIWFDGQKTTQTGPVRQFETPALDPGHDYTYSLRVKWNQNGRDVERAREITVHAGDRIGLDFLGARGGMANMPGGQSGNYDPSGTNFHQQNGRQNDVQNEERINRRPNNYDRGQNNNVAPSNQGNQPPRPGNVPSGTNSNRGSNESGS